MYRIGNKYKFQLISNGNSIFYTGTVKEFGNGMIRIETIRNEEIILSVDKIVQSIRLDRIGDTNEREENYNIHNN